MALYRIEWQCAFCGQRQSFHRTLEADDTWPSKFEAVCENKECGREQDVPLRSCVATPVSGTG
jgi:hypothetical protein